MKVCISFKHKLYQMLFYTFQPTAKMYEQDCGILYSKGSKAGFK